MSRKKTLLLGTVILTATGFLTRIIGFFYKIFLSRTIGAKEIGLFQLLSPVSGLCSALCIGGISTMMSRTIAARTATQSKKEGLDVLCLGTGFCLTLSFVAAFILHRFSTPIALYFLGNDTLGGSLRILSYSIPLSTIHICVMSYYFAQRKTGIPSIVQLLEQVVRVLSSYLIYLIYLDKNLIPTAQLAVLGLLAGEFASALCSLLFILWESAKERYRLHFHRELLSVNTELFRLSWPLTVNRICITLLHSVEAMLIPTRLQMSGLHTDTSLSIYGILTGMALPVVLFPSAITNSVAVILLPSVAKDQASGNLHHVRRTIERTVHYCVLLGILSTGVFCIYGEEIGNLLFQNKEAGTFLQILAFISPFLYLNSTLSSILNGMGQTRLCFYQNLLCLFTRILFVLCAIPIFGIRGYLWGILASELIGTALNLLFLKRSITFSFQAWETIIKPAFALLIAIGISYAVSMLLEMLGSSNPLIGLLCPLAAMGIVYLLPCIPRHLPT